MLSQVHQSRPVAPSLQAVRGDASQADPDISVSGRSHPLAFGSRVPRSVQQRVSCPFAVVETAAACAMSPSSSSTEETLTWTRGLP